MNSVPCLHSRSGRSKSTGLRRRRRNSAHLSFFSRSGLNHHAGFGRGRPSQLPHEALEAGVATRETMAVHQILPDSHRVAALCQSGFDDLPVGFASARRMATVWLPRRFFGVRVGGHPYGRFWRRLSPPARRSHRDSGRPKICPGGFAAKMRRRFNAPQRLPKPSQRDDLLFLFFAQDIAHVTESNLPASSMSRFRYLIGRFSGVHDWSFHDTRRRGAFHFHRVRLPLSGTCGLQKRLISRPKVRSYTI